MCRGRNCQRKEKRKWKFRGLPWVDLEDQVLREPGVQRRLVKGDRVVRLAVEVDITAARCGRLGLVFGGKNGSGAGFADQDRNGSGFGWTRSALDDGVSLYGAASHFFTPAKLLAQMCFQNQQICVVKTNINANNFWQNKAREMLQASLES